MEEEKNTDIGLAGGALERTKGYFNSNLRARYNGILVPDTQKTLKTFAKEHGFETKSDTDTLEDDKLAKYTVHKMLPTRRLEEFDDPNQIYLITDCTGRDIGTYDASTGKFTLSPDIAELNRDILEDIPGGEGLQKEFEEPSFKQITEKLAKGESIVLTPEKANLMVKQKEFADAGQNFDVDQTEEERAMAEIPEGAKPLVAKIKEKLPNVQLKEILIVNSPETLQDDLGKNSGIRSNGGPVIIVSAVNKEGMGGMDDVYMFQDDAEIPNVGESKETILEVMEQHKGEGVVDDFSDDEKEHIVQKIEEQYYLTETKVEQLKEANFESEDQRAAAIAQEYKDLGEYAASEIDYHDREEDMELNKMVTDIQQEGETAEQQVEEQEDYTPFSKYEEGNGPKTIYN